MNHYPIEGPIDSSSRRVIQKCTSIVDVEMAQLIDLSLAVNSNTAEISLDQVIGETKID